jgi:hypothetical protein
MRLGGSCETIKGYIPQKGLAQRIATSLKDAAGLSWKIKLILGLQ